LCVCVASWAGEFPFPCDIPIACAVAAEQNHEMMDSENSETRRIGRIALWLLAVAALLAVLTGYMQFHKGKDFPDTYQTDMISGAL
jgi:hypothetical protein